MDGYMTGRRIRTCLVVGAGISGLIAAKTLYKAGIKVTVIDKGRIVGGRMGTRRMATDQVAQARADHGAQYFTVNDDRFGSLVNEWLDAGVARKWCDRFACENGEKCPGDKARYCGADGMNTIARHLAADLEVRTANRVTRVKCENNVWTALTEEGLMSSAAALILTPPVPQSLAILDAGKIQLDPEIYGQLNNIEYESCIALMAMLDAPSLIPAPGGIGDLKGPVKWLADNYMKGISPGGYSLTIHASPEYSMDRWNDADDTIAEELLEAVTGFMSRHPISYQVHRWLYSQVTVAHDKPFILTSQPAPLVFAGDGFGVTGIEGAALSGLAAAEALLNLET